MAVFLRSRISFLAVSLFLVISLRLQILAAEISSTTSPAPALPKAEHIYICCIYGPDARAKAMLPEMLRRLGAQAGGGVWYYTNEVQNKVFVIHLVKTAEDMIRALYTEDAHIMINGHSNYGMGSVFPTTAEEFRQTISNIKYVDDDRFLTYSSPWVAINIPKLLTRQAYPNWWPVYKDGTSAIAPYDFDDPRGNLAYNFYLTYQVPGDATHYKIEPVPNSALQRFPDSGWPAWFSADGSKPDSKKPEERKYFFTNTNTTFQSVGRWHVEQSPAGFYGSNYLSIAPGTGSNQVKWNFTISTPGTYTVSTRWPTAADNCTNAAFVVAHVGGTSTVSLNERQNGGDWVRLGAYAFEAGDYSVTLSDRAADGSGDLIADAIQISGPTNAAIADQIVDNVSCPKPHFGKKTLVAVKDPRIDTSKLRYKRMFYEGCLSGIYYLDVFHRGLAFYTLADSYLSVSEAYLREYLQGESDEQIWRAVQQLQPVFDYYDFSLPPSRQRERQSDVTPVPTTLRPADEARLSRLALNSPAGVFETLRRPEMVQNEALAHVAVKTAFGERKEEGIRLALAQMSVPLIERNEEGRQSRIRALIAAKRIMETFPQEAVPQLLALYARGDWLVRGNIIRASGGIQGGGQIRNLLVSALDDKTVCEGPEWNSGGAPMRLCDEAYNQLIFRYGIKGLMHTIAPPLSVEIRQYHIDKLKARLSDIKD